MVERKLITKITIPKYIREVQISASIRPKYWKWNGITIKSGSRKLLQKFILKYAKNAIKANKGNVLPQYLKEEFKIVGFKGKKFYCNLNLELEEVNIQKLTKSQSKLKTNYLLCTYEVTDTGVEYTPVIANEDKVGKPNMKIIRGQDFYVGLNPHIRNNIVSTLKSSYWDKFKILPLKMLENLREALDKSYPLMIEAELKDTVKNVYDNSKTGNGRIWDVGNRTEPYMKTFLDFLVNGYITEDGNVGMEGMIVDDDRLHISTGNNSFFTPIKDSEDRALVFYIYQDTREVWKQYIL